MATFADHLSADVVRLLLATYAVEVDGRPLRWAYEKLPARRWGEYSHRHRLIAINESKTRGMFRQQVETVLHEIRHANQHAAALQGNADGAMWTNRHSDHRAKGYWDSAIEVDARAFAAAHVDEAMAAIGRLYGGKVDGDLDDVVEELVELWDEQGTLSRRDVGEALLAYDANNAANMRTVLAQLAELGAEVR